MNAKAIEITSSLVKIREDIIKSELKKRFGDGFDINDLDGRCRLTIDGDGSEHLYIDGKIFLTFKKPVVNYSNNEDSTTVHSTIAYKTFD